MLHSLKMTNVGPAPEMELDFGSRLNLITGDNGLGKSFLLDTIWWALTRKWPEQLNPKLTSGYMARPTDPDQPATIEFKVDSKTTQVVYKSQYVRRDQAWTGKSGRPWNPGLVIYAQADGSFSVWDPARNYWKTRGKVDVQDQLPGYVFTGREVWDGLEMIHKGSPVPVCKGLINDLVNWIASGADESARVNAVLSRLSPSRDPEEKLRSGIMPSISINTPGDIPTIQSGSSTPVPIMHASAGIKRIVQLAYMLVWTWKEHIRVAKELGVERAQQVVFLIDEIECHLHPRWQRTILGSLLEMIKVIHKSAQIQLIVSTHSPMVMVSAEPIFNHAKDAWFDIDLDRASGVVALRKRPFVRLGVASNWLMSDAFDLPTERSPEGEHAVLVALEVLRQAKPHADKIKEVTKELQTCLGETDRFWVRWSDHFLNGKVSR